MNRTGIGRYVLFWLRSFVGLGLALFVVFNFFALPLDDAGLATNRLVNTVMYSFVWPMLVADKLALFPEGPPTNPEPHFFGYLAVQLVGWGLLGILVGLLRAKQIVESESRDRDPSRW